MLAVVAYHANPGARAGFFHYLRDRIVMPETTPSFAERVAYWAGVVVSSVA